jgi:hypothetical protein
MHGRSSSTSWASASASISSARPDGATSEPARRRKSVQRLKDKLGAMLVSGNVGRWEEVDYLG